MSVNSSSPGESRPPGLWCWALINVHYCDKYFHFLSPWAVADCASLSVCFAVWKNRHMRTVTNYFIVNLSLADVLVTIICLPASLVVDITETWFFGHTLCKIVPYLQVRRRLLYLLSKGRVVEILTRLKPAGSLKIASITQDLCFHKSTLLATRSKNKTLYDLFLTTVNLCTTLCPLNPFGESFASFEFENLLFKPGWIPHWWKDPISSPAQIISRYNSAASHQCESWHHYCCEKIPNSCFIYLFLKSGIT